MRLKIHAAPDMRLDDYNARLYDPSLGRFLSVDPLIAHPESTQGINPYSYVENAPLNATDPTGEMPEPSLCNRNNTCAAMTASALNGTMAYNPDAAMSAQATVTQTNLATGATTTYTASGASAWTLANTAQLAQQFDKAANSMGDTNINDGTSLGNSQTSLSKDVNVGSAAEVSSGKTVEQHTVTVYEPKGKKHNPFNHITGSVDGRTPVGLDPAQDLTDTQVIEELTGLNSKGTPGVVEPDPGQPILDSVTLRISGAQAQRMQAAVDERTAHPGNYQLKNNNCAEFWEEVLQSGGVNVPYAEKPDTLMQELHNYWEIHQHKYTLPPPP